MKPGRILAAAGAVVAIGIVGAAVVLRAPPAPDPIADAERQAQAVERFHDLVVAGRWEDVYPLVSQPPGGDATAFAALMAERERIEGRIVAAEVLDRRLRRSRSVPLLEVDARVAVSRPEGVEREQVTSFFGWEDGAWRFLFSAPGA